MSDCATLWTIACQAFLSVEFSRQEYWKYSGILEYHAFLQGIFPTQGSNRRYLMYPALAGGYFTSSDTWEAQYAQNSALIALLLLNDLFITAF